MAAKYDIKINQGSTFKIALTIKDSDNNPIDITGYDFCGQIRKSVSDEVVQASFSFSIQNQSTNTGEVVCTISDTDTAAIEVNKSRGAERVLTEMTYDIESTINNETTRWVEGIATISPEASKC